MRRRQFLAGLALLWATPARADERRRLIVALAGDVSATVTAQAPPLPATLDDLALRDLRAKFPDAMRAFEDELRIALYASPRHGGTAAWSELCYP